MDAPFNAMLLAAGFGTRLKVLTEQRPKPMMPVCGVPLVRWSAAQCAHHGAHRLVINLHHMGEQIQHEIGDGDDMGLQVAYAPEPQILGTGGGIRAMARQLPRTTCLVANAKQINDVDLSAALAFHRRSGSLATLVVRPDPNAEKWGAIGVGEGGRITRILDAAAPGAEAGEAHMFTGIHIVEPELIDAIPGGVSCIVRETYMPLIKAGGAMSAFVHWGYFYDHSTPARYLQGNLNLLEEHSPHLAHAPHPPRGISKSVNVAQSARVDPNCYVGPGVTVGAEAVVGPGVVLGAGARVAAGVRLSECVVWDGVEVTEDQERTIVTPSGILPVPDLGDPAAAPR
jgi:mannose-1-phosphate guanylyltransferase